MIETVLLELKLYEQSAQRYILSREHLENDILTYINEWENLSNQLYIVVATVWDFWYSENFN